MAKKFIIAVQKDMYKEYLDGKRENFVAELRFGNVSYHKELMTNCEYCLGGGTYDGSLRGDVIILSGESADFGPPRWNLDYERIDCELPVPKEIKYIGMYENDCINVKPLLTFI